MALSTTVELPSGLWRDGVCYKDVDLIPVTGAEEAFLLDDGVAMAPAIRTTALLSRCVTRLGGLNEVTQDDIRDLTVGDREALVLHLRRLTLGDPVECIVTCPASDCGAMMEFAFKADDLLSHNGTETQAYYERVFDTERGAWKVSFRLPTGADQESVIQTALVNPRAAAERLLVRCVASVADPEEREAPKARVPPELASALARALSELDPLAEIRFNLTCPDCDHVFPLIFDTADFFYRELQGRRRNIFDDVHLLAYHYHWSEAEILAMTSARRRRYLALLGEQLTQEARG